MATTMKSVPTRPVPGAEPAYKKEHNKNFIAGIVALLVIMVIIGLLTWLASVGTFSEPMDFDYWMMP